jgi:hypothetical protein
MKTAISAIPAQRPAIIRAEASPRSAGAGLRIRFDEFTASPVDDGNLEAQVLAMEIEMSRTVARS